MFCVFKPTSGVGKLWPMATICFCKPSFVGTQPYRCIYMSMAAVLSTVAELSSRDGDPTAYKFACCCLRQSYEALASKISQHSRRGGVLTCFDFFNKVIKKFRDEELEHHDTGLEHDAELVRPTFTVRLWCSGHLFGRWRGRKASIPRKLDFSVTIKDRKPMQSPALAKITQTHCSQPGISFLASSLILFANSFFSCSGEKPDSSVLWQ